MKKGGRISSAALNIVEANFSDQRRPEAPDSLTPRQQEIWHDVCRDEPVGHFATAATQQLLSAYCVAVSTIEALADNISGFKQSRLKTQKGMAAYNTCLKTHALAVTNAVRLATKLRITNQSRYRHEDAATASRDTAKRNKVWD